MDSQSPARRRPRVVCAGHATLDAILCVPGMPVADHRLPATAGTLAGGGPAATAAVALARLGVPVAFAGRVADDEAGRLIRAGLAAEGVDLELLETVPGASPFTAVLLDPQAGRALVPAPGNLPPLNLHPALVAALETAEWLHVDHVGASLLPALGEAGRKTRISVDGGNPIPGLSLEGVALYAPTTQTLLAQTGAASLDAALEAALDEGAELVVATNGDQGAMAAWRMDGRTQRTSAPAASVSSLVSTLGAGDVFHGALLAALVEGRSIADGLTRANTAAAASTRALDGRSAIPRRAELDALVAAGEFA
jgi:sulfofructose kinase